MPVAKGVKWSDILSRAWRFTRDTDTQMLHQGSEALPSFHYLITYILWMAVYLQISHSVCTPSLSAYSLELVLWLAETEMSKMTAQKKK